jgi:hypothetical protein
MAVPDSGGARGGEPRPAVGKEVPAEELAPGLEHAAAEIERRAPPARGAEQACAAGSSPAAPLPAGRPWRPPLLTDDLHRGLFLLHRHAVLPRRHPQGRAHRRPRRAPDPPSPTPARAHAGRAPSPACLDRAHAGRARGGGGADPAAAGSPSAPSRRRYGTPLLRGCSCSASVKARQGMTAGL